MARSHEALDNPVPRPLLPVPSSSLLPVHIRWMIRRDMPSVLAIEQECFEFPWYEDDFVRCLRQRNCIGMVAELDDKVVGYMESAGVPAPNILLPGAIVFLIVGSLSVMLGFKARLGAVLLLTFLILATYYFHAFWALEGQQQQEQTIQFMKNLSMMGAMLFIIANGSGPMSLDNRSRE